MSSDDYVLPVSVISKAGRSTRLGARIRVTPNEIVTVITKADCALNGDSNDAEHDALLELREWLSDVLEDPDRRITP